MRSFRLAALCLLALSLTFIPFEFLSAHRIVGRRVPSSRNDYLRGHRWRTNHRNAYPSRWGGWQGNPFGWPSHYAYYGYPISGSLYYYSFPTNSNFYYSYPSYFSDWTYPSYPYVGKYYVNNAPVPSSRLHPPYHYNLENPRSFSIITPAPSPYISETPQEKPSSGVFFSD